MEEITTNSFRPVLAKAAVFLLLLLRGVESRATNETRASLFPLKVLIGFGALEL
jgi:hypothetical protein